MSPADVITFDRPTRQTLPAFIVFDAPGADGTAATRLKRFLKNALRAYGLRCVELRYPTPAELGKTKS